MILSRSAPRRRARSGETWQCAEAFWDLHLEGAVQPAATPIVEGPDSEGRTDAEVEAVAAACHALWN